MTCSHCGRLNPDESEACIQCGRPLAAGAAEMCAEHPLRRAIAACSQCDKPLCEQCRVSVSGSPYCAEHAVEVTTAARSGGAPGTPVVDIATKAPATFGQRVASGFVDLLLYAAFLMIIYLLLWIFAGLPPTDPSAGGWRTLFRVLALLTPLAYLTYENAAGGRTVGKAASDLIALREDGSLMDFPTAALRAILSMAGFLLGGIGFWYILWDPAQRALHDRWTRTVVIRD